MGKFKCPKCGKEIEIPKVRTYFRKGQSVNINLETNEEILCQDCKEKMSFVPEKGNFQSVYSQFSTLSPLEKQQLLRKRSREDAKKQKYVEQDREKVHFNA